MRVRLSRRPKSNMSPLWRVLQGTPARDNRSSNDSGALVGIDMRWSAVTTVLGSRRVRNSMRLPQGMDSEIKPIATNSIVLMDPSVHCQRMSLTLTAVAKQKRLVSPAQGCNGCSSQSAPLVERRVGLIDAKRS